MTTPTDPRLQRLLGGPSLLALRQRLRRHFERGGSGTGSLHLSGLDPTEHEALAQLVGRPARPARSLRLDLSELDSRLRAAGIAGSLREAMEQLDGPIAHLSAERAAAQSAWSATVLRQDLDPRLQAWLQSSISVGLLKRLARQDAPTANALLTQATTVLARLPAAALPRAQLAAQTLGDAHGLDAGRPVATLVLAACRRPAEAASAGEPTADAEDGQPDTTLPAAEERIRDTWARHGVLVNELARPVLVLNLPTPTGDDRVPWLPGEPAFLSLRWLLRRDLAWPAAGRSVFVCENPNLLAIAADRLGERCAPLVCTDGMPAAAQRSLLEQLAQAGARLRCHADFDWPGVRILNHLLLGAGTTPWRMDAVSYEDAARMNAASLHALTGAEVDATWDAQLRSAMRGIGQAIAEEALVDSLLDDLVH